MSGAIENGDHNGTCPFCGSAVRQGFNTCSSCGATYRESMTSERLVATMLFWGILGFFLAALIVQLAAAAVSFASAKFGYYADNVFGREQFGKDWSETMQGAAIGLWVVIWFVVLRRCLRARKHFMWFRVQS